jgi:hypothetical protein
MLQLYEYRLRCSVAEALEHRRQAYDDRRKGIKVNMNIRLLKDLDETLHAVSGMTAKKINEVYNDKEI